MDVAVMGKIWDFQSRRAPAGTWVGDRGGLEKLNALPPCLMGCSYYIFVT
jgi:hypothetical protein